MTSRRRLIATSSWPSTSNLSWTLNRTATVLQPNCIRLLLEKAGLSRRPLTQAYRGLIKSILTAGFIVCFGNTTQAERTALHRVVKTAERIAGMEVHSVGTL